MKKVFFLFCTIFCTALIAVSIYQMKTVPEKPIDTPHEISYIVREHGGKIAVFIPEEAEPLAVYEVYVHLLPENDIELLRKGIAVDDDYTLMKTLENFGL